MQWTKIRQLKQVLHRQQLFPSVVTDALTTGVSKQFMEQQNRSHLKPCVLKA